jgi:hypothetical protein
MADRIAYVAWTRASGLADEYLAKVQGWNDDADDTHHEHTYDLVFYQDMNAKAVIRALSPGHRIYIKGHGIPGDHKIYPSVNGPDSDGLKYNDVCDHLIESGLQKRWLGVIVCDNCYSAVPSLGSQAFAAKVSQYMRGKGYLLISFIGLFGPVGSNYVNRGGKYSHRYVRPFDEDMPWGAKAGSKLEQFKVKSKWAQWRF